MQSIGLAIADFILFPLRGVLQIMSKIPGVGGFAKTALDSLSALTAAPDSANEINSVSVVAPNQAAEDSKRELSGNASIVVSAADTSKIETIKSNISGVNLSEMAAN